MAKFRVETVLDKTVGKYYIELYLEDNDTPLVVSQPIYITHEHAISDAVEIFKKAMPDQPITAWSAD